MTREEAIQYAADKLNKGLYRLDLGYLNRGLYQIVAREVDFMRVAISALREQESKDTNAPTKWISVEESLPEDGECVLVCTQTRKIKDARYLSRSGRFIAAGNLVVTHWRPLPPLPEAPKEV